METIAVKAAGWVVAKALAPVTDGLLESWAASKGLGPNVDELKVELLYAQAMLDNAREREIRSPALKELLIKMRQLAYDADDVLDELDYFRIQDELDGTYHAADEHAGGCIDGLVLNARHTARAVAAKLKPSTGCLSSVCSRGGRTVNSSPPSPTNKDDDHKDSGDGKGRRFFCGASLPSKVKGCCGKCEMSSSSPSPTTSQCDKITSAACNTTKSIVKCLQCCSFQSADEISENPNTPANKKRFLPCSGRSVVRQRENDDASQAPKLKFNRVDISEKIKDITEHLKPVCAKVSNILNLEFMGTNRITRQDIAKKRPITTSDITEDKLYGRDNQKKRIVDGITHGEYFAKELVVLAIVGPGGIGKTTFTQHTYEEVKRHFDVYIWICVSLNFSAGRLAHEAVKQIPRVDGEKENGSDQELINQRLKGKRFLLVLDDMWACHEEEWEKLLASFAVGGGKGNIVIVTTRIPKVAKMVSNKKADCYIQMERLEREDFMHFFEACIFGGQKPWEGHEELREVGEKIVSKLKGFPLAAKTVGRLLKSQLTLEHWTSVLESKEWELQTDENDIMPALKLSYDYLPFHLQQCFYYCALFPEDYKFESKELVHFWIGLDIIHPSNLNRRIEDVGQSYLDDLVNHGFFKKGEGNRGCPYYVVHDLLHDLAVTISSFECHSIHSSNVKSAQIPQDVRHLSIIVDNKDVEDIKTFKYYKNDLSALGKRLKVENLRTLMVLGEHHGTFVKTFYDLFDKATALRAIYLSSAQSSYLSGAPYTMEDMLCNFSKLIHLRYIRIISVNMENTGLLSVLSRFYHLEVIDLQEWRGCFGFTRHMSNLVKLRHFLVPEDKLQLHSDIVEVGKMKLLQELRMFEVGKEDKGFDLSQLGQLSELGGSLAICSLERMQAMKEAEEARLIQINRLHKLTLEWGASQLERDIAHEENALGILVPQSNLQHLCIRGHGGTKCPQWLREKLSVKILESLHLDSVAWNTFPPIGDLWLVDEPHEENLSNIRDNKFQNLKRLELVNLPRLKKWVVHDPCKLFAHLEVLVIKYCSNLTELSFSHCTCCQQEKEKEANMIWFPSLRELEIQECPELLSFPPIPWTSAPCSVKIDGTASGLVKLVCMKNYKSEYSLDIEGRIDLDSIFWNVLAFGNLTELEELEIRTCPPLPVHHLNMLSSLKTITLEDSSSIVFPWSEGLSRATYQFPVECMVVDEWGASAKELTQLLTYFPKLSELNVRGCKKITELGVEEQQATATPVPSSSSSNKADDTQIEQHQQQDGTRAEEEIAAEGLLLLPAQLQKLGIKYCRDLSLRSGGQGLQGLRSLRSLGIWDCPRFLSSYSSSSSPPCFPFPSSLERLYLVGVETLLPLSNLTSLTDLSIENCGNLRGEGLWPLLAQARLTKLTVHGTPNFFAGSKPSLPHEQEFSSSSSKLQELDTDDVAGVLAAPIWALLSSSLTELYFWGDTEVERFTKEQEEALQRLTSLEGIRFWECHKLQCLPAGLHRLPNLEILGIDTCGAIRSLPKDGLPGSLQVLVIENCPAIRSLPKDCLPGSLQKLVIESCPAIRSLPKVDDLPSSLRQLDVRDSESEELKRHCRKVIGIIPIVRA